YRSPMQMIQPGRQRGTGVSSGWRLEGDGLARGIIEPNGSIGILGGDVEVASHRVAVEAALRKVPQPSLFENSQAVALGLRVYESSPNLSCLEPTYRRFNLGLFQ